MKIGYKELLDKAMAEVETISVDKAKELHSDETAQFVDLRDIRELKMEGKVPGSYHMPRGMIEFWIDISSQYLIRTVSLYFIASQVGFPPWQPRRHKAWVCRMSVTLMVDSMHGSRLTVRSKIRIEVNFFEIYPGSESSMQLGWDDTNLRMKL